LRLSGALGPLQSEAVTGVLDFAIAAAPGGSRVTLTYSVGGYMRRGLTPIAPIVDKVLVEQLDGYKRSADSKG